MNVRFQVTIIQRAPDGSVIGSSHNTGDGRTTTAYRNTRDGLHLSIEADGRATQNEENNKDVCQELLNYFSLHNKEWISFEVLEIENSKDERGVDAIFKSQTEKVECQITKVPLDPKSYSELASGKNIKNEILEAELIDQIWKAIHKKDPRSDQKRWLILDSIESAEFTTPPVVKAFCKKYDLSSQKWTSIWLVGHSSELVYKL